MTDFADTLRRQVAQAQEVRLAGLWGMTYTRAAMDPRYRTEEARDKLVKTLLSTRLPGCHELAAAALTGWVEGHPPPVCTCPWVETAPPAYDPDQDRTRHPHHREWSWTCPVERHRDYRAALFHRSQERADA